MYIKYFKTINSDKLGGKDSSEYALSDLSNVGILPENVRLQLKGDEGPIGPEGPMGPEGPIGPEGPTPLYNVGDIGSYSLLFYTGGTSLDLGAIIQGSSLKYASTWNGVIWQEGAGTISPPGTWRAMSQVGGSNGGLSNGDATLTAIWLRIS